MRKPIQTIISIIFLFSVLHAGPSVYLYIINFDNITQESSIDWLGQGFVNMLNIKLVDVSKLRLNGQDDLEAIMNNRSLLLHQPRGSRNFLLLGKYERKLDNVEVEVNRKLAIKKAIDCSNENSVVLILGKGDEEYQIIYDKKFPLNDKDIVNKILA